MDGKSSAMDTLGQGGSPCSRSSKMPTERFSGQPSTSGMSLSTRCSMSSVVSASCVSRLGITAWSRPNSRDTWMYSRFMTLEVDLTCCVTLRIPPPRPPPRGGRYPFCRCQLGWFLCLCSRCSSRRNSHSTNTFRSMSGSEWWLASKCARERSDFCRDAPNSAGFLITRWDGIVKGSCAETAAATTIPSQGQPKMKPNSTNLHRCMSSGRVIISAPSGVMPASSLRWLLVRAPSSSRVVRAASSASMGGGCTVIRSSSLGVLNCF
mmetsp:Transcript_50320/g.126044  ORF Transcript_50320/g.126044 Transcript_50320/m.126044 type:complete len:265 (+) Transcript_50320:2290-3084(+)